MITVSHDRYFIDRLATRIIELIPASLGGGTYDYSVSHRGHGYTEFREFREGRAVVQAQSETSSAPAMSAGKEQYLRNKQQASEARKQETRLRKLREESERIEKRIEAIDEELFGEAATDYVKAAALDEEKNSLEDRLMEIYEEIGV